MFKVLRLALLGMLLSGCSTLMFWEDDKKTAASSVDEVADSANGHVEPKSKASSMTEEQELKLARLWARVDELEEEQYRQKEKLRVLEKGMTLGLIPEELKKGKEAEGATAPKVEIKGDHKGEAKDASLEAKAEAALAHADAKNKGEKDEAPANGLSKAEMDAYQAMLAAAHDQFRSGRYGRAIVEFDAIGKQFADRADQGMHRYWIARSWANLKEYNTARQILGDFLRDYPTGPWAPRAKLELGRVEWKLGLQETALKRFRDIIQAHPYEDAAEMAKMELENLDKTL